MPRALCALSALAAYVPPTTSYFCASSAFGARTALDINPYRMRRFSRGPVPNASNDNWEAPTWVRRGPYSARRLKALKASSHVWAAGGARAQARRSTGDVLDGLPSVCLPCSLVLFCFFRPRSLPFWFGLAPSNL